MRALPHLHSFSHISCFFLIVYTSSAVQRFSAADPGRTQRNFILNKKPQKIAEAQKTEIPENLIFSKTVAHTYQTLKKCSNYTSCKKLKISFNKL